MSRIAGLVVLAVLMALVAAFPAGAVVPEPPKTPTVVGSGGSASSVDPLATKTAVDVLRSGGNAVDAAVAAAGVLGVTEPFSCGIGGGGFMVIYDARRDKVETIDSREAAPARVRPDTFSALNLDPDVPEDFAEARVSGLSVGVPGTVAGWETALKRYGSRPLRSLLRPAERIGREGFVIDETFKGQVDGNKALFGDFPATAKLYLNGAGEAKGVDTVQRNEDLADTYERIGDDPDRFYNGRIARDIVQTVRQPPKRPASMRNVRPGKMTLRDLRRYDAIRRDPTRISYRGLDIVGMGPPSSGGTTVGEALNILEALPPTADRTTVLHRYLEASKLAYADRNEWVGDPAYFDVPLRGLLSDAFARDRALNPDAPISDTSTLSTPQPAGDPRPYEHGHGHGPRAGSEEKAKSTTHLTVADRWGNIVSYTFTIEQIGGNGMVVPGRGFMLNNELTDFNFTPDTANSPAGGKRPRSSMAPTLVFNHGRPELALGSPGGATIITTVLQTLVNYIDLHQSLPDAVAAPRASQRNSEPTPAEPAFITQYGTALTALGHSFTRVTPDPPSEIGSVEAIRFLPDGRQLAVAEPTRRGGGHAMVVSGP